MPSAQAEKLIRLLFERRPPPGPLDVEKLRQGMESTALPVADDVTVSPIQLGGVEVEVITAPNADSGRKILYFHGGGYVMGSPRTHRKLAGDLSRAAQAQVVLPDYPLAPEAPFPAALNAATTLYESIIEGTSSRRVSIAGDSAGGGLTLAVLLNIRNSDLPVPGAAALISPWLDMTNDKRIDPALVARDPIVAPADMAQMSSWYLGSASPTSPFASPGLADLTGLPPILVQVGTAEILLAESRALAERAKQFGISLELEEWPDMVHVWHVFAGRVPEATEAVERLGAFLRDHTA